MWSTCESQKDVQPYYLFWKCSYGPSKYLSRRIKLSKPTATTMILITAINDQLCNPCNKNLCLIKLKQVLNCKVHNLGKTASLVGSHMRGFAV